jgi:hypothetical protein
MWLPSTWRASTASGRRLTSHPPSPPSTQRSTGLTIVNGVLAEKFVRPGGRVTVPTACSGFPSQYDRCENPLVADTPAARRRAEARYDLVDFKRNPHGGHFPALERATLWMDHIRTFLHDRH